MADPEIPFTYWVLHNALHKLAFADVTKILVSSKGLAFCGRKTAKNDGAKWRIIEKMNCLISPIS